MTTCLHFVAWGRGAHPQHNEVAAPAGPAPANPRLGSESCQQCANGIAVCLQGFYYANGVALSPDESYVIMAETDTISAHKIWVKGPKVRFHPASSCMQT